MLTSKQNIENYRFLKSDYLNDELKQNKFLVSLWLCLKENQNDILLFNEHYLLELYKDEIKDMTEEDLFKIIEGKILSIKSPSILCKWLGNFYIIKNNKNNFTELINITIDKLINNELWFNSLLDKKIEVEIEDLCLQSGEVLPTSFISYLNFKSPRFTGYYFENLLYYVLTDKTEIKDYDNFYIENINKPESLKFTKQDYNFLMSFDDEVLKASIQQYLVKEITTDKYNEIWEFVDVIQNEKYKGFLINYIEKLKRCTFIRKYKNNNIKHSIKVKNNNINGEIDFIINDDIILDSKVVKNSNSCIYHWYYQLSLYEFCLSNQIYKKIIINFMNSKIFYYK